MSAAPEPSVAPPRPDPLRNAAPVVDDVEARRARAAIESRLFSGPPQPVRVGRYRVEGRIGAGGMGVVYRAHDPELARDVAVKLMNADAAGTKDPATARARLVREARAMARLAHPNVIHVYDVGTVEDGVFIAMELVDGRSLSAWLAEERPTWLEILRKAVEAGRGLAAAHAAGVIHRDFKPENVLVGQDGRVRVVDFGLAGGPAALGSGSVESELDRDTGDLHGPSGSLTRTGTLLGTPKYMAPEQESGALANARSDQFSFCVALYEALYGYPPFAGDSVSTYRDNVRHGRVRDPPAGTKVRPWVHTLLVRGLAIDPADRHPDLGPLLDRLDEALIDPALARRRTRRSWALALTGVAAVLVLGGMGAWLAREDPEGIAPAQAAAVPATLAQPAAVPSPAASPPSDERNDAAQEPGGPLEPEAVPREATPSQAAPSQAAPSQAAPSDPPRAPEDADGAAPPPDPASDEPGTQATAEPAAAEADAPAEPAEATKPRPRRKRSAGTCYFQQDRFNFLQRRRRHQRFVTATDGQCYDCEREAPSYRRDQLSPSDCSRYYLCLATDGGQCAD